MVERPNAQAATSADSASLWWYRAGRLYTEIAALGLAVALCAALVALAGLRRPPIELGIAAERLGGPAFAAGLYAREQHPDGYAYRWTSGSALIQLRGAANFAPAYLAELRLRAEHPAGPQPLIFSANGRDLAATTPEARFRRYRLLIAPGAEQGELWMGLRTPTFVAPANPRPLGVMLASASLRPQPRADLAGAATAGLGLLLFYALLRIVGGGARPALALTGLFGLGLVGLAWLYRPAPLPYSTLAGLASAAALAAVGLARPIAARMGLAALALIVAFAGVIWPAWLSDDAFISFRYAQNLVDGHGLVYNQGERVEGYTNFLWTLLAAGVLALGGDLAWWSHLAGVVLGLAIVLLLFVQAVRLLPPAWALLAALICATSQSLLLYTARGSGLETGLFALLLLLAGMAYLGRSGEALPAPSRLALVGALFALAAMTRPEGVLVGGLTGLHLLATLWARGVQQAPDQPSVAQRSRPLPAILALAGAFLALFLPYFLWRLSYYGDLLPNTFYAKTGGGLQQILRGLAYAGGFALSLGGPLLLVITLPWLRDWRAALASWRGYLLPIVGAYSAYIVAVGGDHFRGERFFVPILPWLAILLADGLSAAYARIFKRSGQAEAEKAKSAFSAPSLVNVLLGIAIAAGAVAALARTDAEAETIRGLDESVWIWREIGWWVADQGLPDASVAASGAGAVAYYSRHTTVDLLGLTDKHIGRLEVADMGAGVAGHEKRDPAYVLGVRRPTYIPQIWDDYFGGPGALRERYTLTPIVTRSGRELQMWVRKDE